MTGPVTTEALVEALTQFLLDRSGETLWQCEARAKAIIAGPLAPLLAAHQQQSASIASLRMLRGMERCSAIPYGPPFREIRP